MDKLKERFQVAKDYALKRGYTDDAKNDACNLFCSASYDIYNALWNMFDAELKGGADND